MNKILVVIVIVLLALFAILIPIIPISVPVYQVLVMRGECASPALALRDSVLIFGSISVWILLLNLSLRWHGFWSCLLA